MSASLPLHVGNVNPSTAALRTSTWLPRCPPHSSREGSAYTVDKLRKGMVASWEGGMAWSLFVPLVGTENNPQCVSLLLALQLAFSDHSWLQITETPKARPQISVGGVFPPPPHTPSLKNKICFDTRVISTHSVNTLCHKLTRLLTIRSADGFWVQNIYKSHFSGIWPKR